MSKRALVTGGLGFIGSCLARRLADEGWQVTVVDLQPNNGILDSKKIDVYDETDFVDILDHVVVSRQPEVVFHEAAFPRVAYSTEHPIMTTENNLMKTVRLLDWCREHAKRFIFASSSSVCGNAKTPTSEDHLKNAQSLYAQQKASAEEFCRLYSQLYGLDTVCLRYFNVFGPGQDISGPYATAISNWCHAIKNNLPLRSDGDGTQSRDLAYIENVLDANVLAANSDKRFEGDCFNVACNDSISNNEILEYLKKRYPQITIENAPARPGDVYKTHADISKISEVLGYEPRFTFWEGLERTLEWWELK